MGSYLCQSVQKHVFCAFKRPVALFAVILLFSCTAYSQTSRGTVSGTVLDSSGAVVVGSSIGLTNPDTGVVRTTSTNRAGIYRFDAVDLGRYNLKISMHNFKTFLYEVFQVEANRTVTIDASLEPAGIEAVVEVIGGMTEASLIRDSPLRGSSTGSSELVQIPYAWRDPFVFAPSPGVSYSNTTGFTNSADLTVNGQRPRGNNFMLDGTDNNDVSFGGQAQSFKILDAVQEVSSQTGNFGVEFGRAGGGVFNMITKSGTNEFHGTLSWRLLSQAFDATNNLTILNTPAGQKPKKPVYTENIYGFTLGGPIVKNKTFFFAGLQQDSRRSTNDYSFVLPTEDAVTKLKAFFPNNPRLNLYLNAIGGLRGAAKPITIILGIDPVTAVDRGTVQFATALYPQPYGYDAPQLTFRLDHNLTDTHRLSFRYTYDQQSGQTVAMFPGYYYDYRFRKQNFLFSDSYTLSPTWTNEFRVSYSRFGYENAVSPNSVPEAQTMPYLLIPSVSAPGSSPAIPNFQFANKWLYQETQSKLIGRHTLRYGFEFVQQLTKRRPPFIERGALGYQNAVTPSYSGFANYLDDFSGPAGISTRNFGEAVFYPNQFRQSYFFQDIWKVKPSFTLILGLRYENFGTPANIFTYPAFAGFDTSKFLEPNKVNRDDNNFGPSFGLAWSPRATSGLPGWLFGDGKTVWRGGFQVSYDAFFDSMLANIQLDVPNSVATAFVGSFLGRGTANFVSTLPTTPRPVTPLDPQSSVLDPNIRSPYTERWSFGFQRRLSQKMLLDLSYIGTVSHKLFTNEDVNPRQLNGARVHPDFGIRQIRGSSGNSNYHAMQLRVERRFERNLTFMGTYTWSRMIDSTSEIYAGTSTGFAGSGLTSMPVSQGGLGLDRALSDYHRGHTFNFTFSWDIPGPKSGFSGHLAGGWTLGGIIVFANGAPYTVMNGFDRNNDGVAADRPDIGNPNAPINTRAIISSSCSTGYLNPDSKSCVTPNDVHFVQGTGLPNSKTVGRNTLFTGLNAPVYANAIKAFSLGEGKKLEFRLEAINIFNHPSFYQIPSASVVGSPGPSGGLASRFLEENHTSASNRSMYVQVKIVF